MSDIKDAHGYYAVLDLRPGASISEVKEAYRRLAKDCHPDRSHVSDGGHRFRQITEAYGILSNVSTKAAYDANLTEETVSSEETVQRKIEPISCGQCGKITAQPRHLRFWRITSFLFGSHKGPVQKIYCRSCASRAQWTATIWTSLLGWWGIPWGPAWSIGHGVTNALGGVRDIKVDEALMWQNALAFAQTDNGDLAVGLANILRKSDNAELAQQSADLIRFFSERGVDPSTTLTNAWQRSFVGTTALFGIAFAVPAAAAFAAVSTFSSPSTASVTVAETDDPFANLVPADAGTRKSRQAGTDLPGVSVDNASAIIGSQEAKTHVETCPNPPANGAVLSDVRQPIEEGHLLEIQNGTQGDAIVKLRDASTDRTLASFFVQSGRSASLNRISDGTYRVQYAYGETLGADCRTFVDLQSAGEFPGSETMKTRYEAELDGTRIVRNRLSYTLYSVPGGNVRPDDISAADFNKP